MRSPRVFPSAGALPLSARVILTASFASVRAPARAVETSRRRSKPNWSFPMARVGVRNVTSTRPLSTATFASVNEAAVTAPAALTSGEGADRQARVVQLLVGGVGGLESQSRDLEEERGVARAGLPRPRAFARPVERPQPQQEGLGEG